MHLIDFPFSYDLENKVIEEHLILPKICVPFDDERIELGNVVVATLNCCIPTNLESVQEIVTVVTMHLCYHSRIINGGERTGRLARLHPSFGKTDGSVLSEVGKNKTKLFSKLPLRMAGKVLPNCFHGRCFEIALIKLCLSKIPVNFARDRACTYLVLLKGH